MATEAVHTAATIRAARENGLQKSALGRESCKRSNEPYYKMRYQTKPRNQQEGRKRDAVEQAKDRNDSKHSRRQDGRLLL